jgi:SNF2 family DNA or RNA helicase
MTGQFSDLLKQLRKTSTSDLTTRFAAESFRVQILTDDANGAYLRVINAKGEDIAPDYRGYAGQERTFLKMLESIEERRGFVIDWDKPAEASDRIYLAEYEFLLWQLRGMKNLVNAEFKPVFFHERTEGDVGHIVADIRGISQVNTSQVNSAQTNPTNDEPTSVQENERERLRASICATLDGAEYDIVQILTEYAVLIQRTQKDGSTENGSTEDGSVAYEIVEVPPIGAGYAVLTRFATVFAVGDSERYLSLLFSYFPTLRVRFRDYRVSTEPQEVVKTAPALIFDKVDEENTLYLRLAPMLPQFPQFDTDFLSNYEVSRIVRLNEMEKTLIVSAVESQSVLQHVEDLDKMFAKYAAKLTGKNSRKAHESYIREGAMFILPAELAEEFIRHELKNLIGTFAILGAEKLKSYKIRAVQPALQLHLSSGIDFLEGDASLDIEGEVFSLFDVLSQYRKNSYITLADGTQAIINEQYIAKLERIFTKQKNKVKLSFFDLPLVEELIDETIAASAFQASREIFKGFNALAEKPVKLPKINATLRPYQEQGYKWLRYLYDNNLGGCLADDMGLGKTLQAITLLTEIYPKEKHPTLVVMPKSLLFNWEAELTKFSPKLTFYTYYANTRNLEEAMKSHLVLTTYAMMRNDIELFKEKEFHCVLLDESQNIKNLQSQTAKAVMLLNTQKRFALSGTPIENNLGELYSLFRFLNPAMFGTVENFNELYAAPIQKFGDKEATHDLRKKIYPFILRRLKNDVLKELPSKIEQTLLVDMSAEQSELYEARRRFYHDSVRSQVEKFGIQKSQFMILQALSELRQIASIPESQTDGAIISPKREVLMEQLHDVVSNGRKALVFANFLAGVEVIAEECENAGIRALSMTGATRDRKQLVDIFQNDPDTRVFVMTLKTGGVGLNLTAADTVFLLDPWWNAAAEAQAIDRAHRIGQASTVFAYKLVTRGTIEEKILQLQEKKRALFDSVISSDTASLKALDDDDIEFMLGGGGL